MPKEYNKSGNNKLLEYKITQIDKKLDLVLEQSDLLLKSNARLRQDLAKTLSEAIEAALNKRAIQGYSRIAGSE